MSDYMLENKTVKENVNTQDSVVTVTTVRLNNKVIIDANIIDTELVGKTNEREVYEQYANAIKNLLERYGNPMFEYLVQDGVLFIACDIETNTPETEIKNAIVKEIINAMNKIRPRQVSGYGTIIYLK